MENVSATTTSPENSEDELFDELPSNFKWNDKFEKSFLLNMLRLKPSGEPIILILINRQFWHLFCT